MGKTYRRDSDRKFKNFQKGKYKQPKKLKYNSDEPKFPKHVKFDTLEMDNED